MTAINPGIHNLSDAELDGRLAMIHAELLCTLHTCYVPAAVRSCRKCALKRSEVDVLVEQRHRAETGS